MFEMVKIHEWTVGTPFLLHDVGLGLMTNDVRLGRLAPPSFFSACLESALSRCTARFGITKTEKLGKESSFGESGISLIGLIGLTLRRIIVPSLRRMT